MADDDKKSPDDYEYPSDEYYKSEEPHPDSMEPLEPPGPGGRFPFSRRVMILIGFIVAIGVVYGILTIATRQTVKPVVAPVATPTIPPPVATPQPIIAQPSLPPSNTLAELMQQNQNNQQAIAALQNQMQLLQTQLLQITNSLTTLTNQIQVVAEEVKAVSLDRSLMGRGLSFRPAGKIYHLKALVPGRAWLQTAGGETTTVTIGDRLPGYGIVQMINTQQGIVTTSSGAIIGYGAKDS